MSLQMVLGSAGSGKSRYMLNDVINKSLRDVDLDYVFIVPEQFTMETQRSIVEHHPCGGSMNIDIQSFLRLAESVFDEVGIRRRNVLDDTGKTLILRKVIAKQQGNLKVYGGKVNKGGFVEKVKSVISEFYQYGISIKDLDRLINDKTISPLLRTKLSDIKVIFEAFEKYIARDYIPSEELLKVLCNCIGESGKIRNSEIYIDGFTGFTPVQYELIGLLMKYAKKVTISLTLPSYKINEVKEREQDLFLMSLKTKKRLIKIAGEMKINIEDNVIMDDKIPVRYANSKPLAHLERHLFRYRNQQYMKEQNNITLYEAGGIDEEIHHVIGMIRELTRSGQYRYRDIAIVTGDIESYHRIIEIEMTLSSIPCFVDYKRSIIDNPCVEALRSVLEILNNNFSYESVFRFLRTGMCYISRDDTDIVENIALERGIRGYKRWNSQWRNVDEQINEIRSRIIQMFEDIYNDIGSGKHSVYKITKALYEFMCSMDMEEQLQKYAEFFRENGDLSKEKEYTQIYSLIMGLLDKMVELMGDEAVSLAEYKEILDAGFEEIKVGIIPPSIDCVVAGDIERTRLNNIRVLFFVGVNEGIIPKTGNQSGIFTENDRKKFKNFDIEMAPGIRENAFIQRFYLYLNLTKPSDSLHLSYTNLSGDGSTAKPSYLINEIRKLYKGLTVNSRKEDIDFSLISTDADAIRYISDYLREYNRDDMMDNLDERFKEIYSHYYGSKTYQEYIRKIIDVAFMIHYDNPIDKIAATAIYGKTMNTSISRLEKYAMCAYSHFLQYGLGLKERKMFEIKTSDIGTVYHSAIEIFSKYVNEQYSWNDLDENVRKYLVKKSVNEALSEENIENFNSSARTQYILERVTNMTDATTVVLCRQLAKGCFKPEYFELRFSPELGAETMCIKLNDDSVMNLRGVIDRVDIYREHTNPEKIYIKIIDYKSGEKKFNIGEVFDGRQLQLSMYMHAVVDMEQKKNPDAIVIPAAELYYHIDNPYIEKYNENGIDDSSIRREKKYRMNGLLNNDEEILEMIDSDIAANGTSSVVNVKRYKNGNYDIENGTSTEGFKKLGDFMEYKAAEMGRNILNGEIAVKPYRQGGKIPCQYCEYLSICRFDPSIEGFEYREIDKIKSEEIWSRIISCDSEVKKDGN